MTAQFAPAGYPLEPAGGPTGVAERVGRPLVPQIALMRLLRLAARPAEVVIVIASVRLANRDVSVPIRSSVGPVSEGPRQLTNTAVSKKSKNCKMRSLIGSPEKRPGTREPSRSR